MFVNYPVILSITHMVSNGSLGLQADMKTITVLGGFGVGVTTGVSVKHNKKFALRPLETDFVRFQLETVLTDFGISAAKTGRLFHPAIINTVADCLQNRQFPIVVDPVCRKRSGEALLPEDGVKALRERMVPLATVITPNAAEAEMLTGMRIRNTDDIAKAGRRLLSLGAKAALITGWGAETKSPEITDWLILPRQSPLPLSQPRVNLADTTGCGNTLAVAVAAWLTEDTPLPKVIAKAQAYLNLCLSHTIRRNEGEISMIDLAAPLRDRLGLPWNAAPTRAQQIGIIGNSPALDKALQTASGLAPSMVPVLVLGETGTGKGLFARYIHIASGRPQEKFISVNCAAIPESLLESTLFGHRKGAFTGATSDLKGQFELADGGTLFLDEIAELPPSSQVKLLRVLESGMVQVLGEARPRKVDVRIIAATNQDLNALIASKAFREDLYYRLNVGIVRLPPLRERGQDVPALAQFYLDTINKTLPTPRFFTAAALSSMQLYPWPGNVRELANVIECSARLSPHRMLDVEHLLYADAAQPMAFLPGAGRLEDHINKVRDTCIVQAVELSGGNYSEAGRKLGITPQAVSRHMRLRAQNLQFNL